MAGYRPFKLQIMASDHMVYDGMAESVVVPTTEGMRGILAGHSNLIMAVAPGVMEYQPAGDETEERQIRVVSDGLLKVENGEAIILVDTAERPEEIDEHRAARAAERAREDMRRSKSAREHAIAGAELSRALSRIRASTRKNNKKY